MHIVESRHEALGGREAPGALGGRRARAARAAHMSTHPSCRIIGGTSKRELCIVLQFPATMRALVHHYDSANAEPCDINDQRQVSRAAGSLVQKYQVPQHQRIKVF